MESRRLGGSDLVVTRIGLGTMTFGEQTDRAEAFRQLDVATESGVALIDTAELYPIPPCPETYGTTETIVGDWLHDRRMRSRVVLATKVAGYNPAYEHIRGGRNAQSPANMRAAVDESLKRLRTDWIDLYQVHWADRNTNFTSKIEAVPREDEAAIVLAGVVDTMAALRREGKIRHWGVSNESPWGLMKYLEFARGVAEARPVSVQNEYNVLNRGFEQALAEICFRDRVSLIAYSPLAGGTLTGKYLRGGEEEWRYSRYPQTFGGVPAATETIRKLLRAAAALGVTPEALSYGFLLDDPYCDVLLLGARTAGQLERNLACIRGAEGRGLRAAVLSALTAEN